MESQRLPKQRVLIVESSDRIRQDIKVLLQDSGRYEVVGEATTLAEAIAAARAVSPELALVDVEMGDGNGLGVLRNLRAMLPPNALVVATHSDWEEYDAAARAAGAVASITKTRLFDSLIPTLEEAREGSRQRQSNGHLVRTSNKPVPSVDERSNTVSRTDVSGSWWKPAGWGDWLAGARIFGQALVRGAPMESSPPAFWWRYYEAAVGLLVLMLMAGLLSGGLDAAGALSKGLIIFSLLALAGTQVRQIRRLSKAKRTVKIHGQRQSRSRRS